MGVETASFNGGAKSRFGAALELLKMEFTRNIEGKDAVSDGIQGVVNSGRTLVQGVLEVGPVIWHSVAGALGRKQEFAVQERDGLINGVTQNYSEGVRPILRVLGTTPGHVAAGLYMIVLKNKQCSSTAFQTCYVFSIRRRDVNPLTS